MSSGDVSERSYDMTCRNEVKKGDIIETTSSHWTSPPTIPMLLLLSVYTRSCPFKSAPIVPNVSLGEIR